MTEAQYSRYLEDVRRLTPKAPLLPTLMQGYSKINVIYMRHALSALPEEAEMVEETVEAPPITDTKSALWAKRQTTYAAMLRRSNDFHNCKNDQERAKLSDELGEMYQEFLRLKRLCDSGATEDEIETAEAQEEQIPDNPIELMKYINSIRARISQRRSQILKIAETNSDDKAQKIAEIQKTLDSLINLKARAEAKAKDIQ